MDESKQLPEYPNNHNQYYDIISNKYIDIYR